MKNIFVTGATGFIGSHLINHLSKDKNNKIYGLCRSFKKESTFKALELDKLNNVNILVGNINIFANIEEIIMNYDIDNIYHLAAQPIVKLSSKSPRYTFNTNIIGTLNVLETVKNSYVTGKIIPTYIMSTDKSYGTHLKLPYTENHCLRGIDIYSASKACEDIISRSYAYNFDLPIVVGRPCNIYGEFDFNWSRLIPTLSKTCLDKNNKDDILLNKGSYEHIRQYMYVEDVVIAIELLLNNINKTQGKAYNISTSETYKTKNIVESIISLSKTKKLIKFKEKEKTFKEIYKQHLDSKKIRTLGWKPKYTLSDGLEITLSKYKEWFNKE